MNRLKIYTIIGIFFVLILGTLSHFFYEWSNDNFVIGLFTPVNESTWEHMKLFFFPTLLYALFTIPGLQKDYPCITSAFSAGILLGTLLIPVIFYTYTGILGNHFLFLDIATFIFSVIFSFFCIYRWTLSCKMKHHQFFLCSLLCIVLISFVIFSYNPPEIGLFADPVTPSQS